MKLSSSSTSTIFLSLLLLYIPFSSCTFLPLPSIPIDYDAVRQELDFSMKVEESDSSDPNYYQLAAFLNFLTTYNFTNAYSDSDSSDEIYQTQTGTYNGIIYHYCYPNPSVSNQPMGIYCSLFLSNLSGEAAMAQELTFDFNGAQDYQVNSSNSELLFVGIPTNVSTAASTGPLINQSCVGSLAYSFINAETLAPFNYATDQLGFLSLQVSYQSTNCSLEVLTPLLETDQSSDLTARILPYVFMMIGIAILQLLSCAKLVKVLEQEDITAKRIAVGTVGFFIGFGFYIFLLHFEYWMELPGLMLGVVVLYFMISLFFEPALLFFIIRSIKRTNDVTQIMNAFYRFCFWLLVTSTSVILSFTFVPNCLLYAYPFFLLPQIVDTFLSRRKYRWNLWLLLGVGLPNFLYIIYRGIDPLQIFTGEPSINIIISGSIVLGIQLILLQIQTRKPTFGIKLGKGFDYTDLGTTEEKEIALADTCSICMERLDQKPLNGSTSEDLLERHHRGEAILRTPCKHYYHESCLQEWVKKKLECPNCRQVIPELSEEDD